MTTSYIDLANCGKTFGSLAEAQRCAPQPGDAVVLRDMGGLAPAQVWDTGVTPGKWNLRPYSLADGERGSLLMVNVAGKLDGERHVPPAFEIKTGLTGWYAIWIGVPRFDLRPRFGFPSGVDLAMDDEPFTHVGPESGSRHGRLMGPMDVEWLCFWKCADLTGRSVHVRPGFGTYSSFPWGFVRGAVSSFRFVKLNDAQVAEWKRAAAGKDTRNTIIVDDGFSEYWQFSKPGNGIDRRLPQIYGHSDVAKVMLQSPSTGVASWPSRVTSLMGEGMIEDDWTSRRLGDRRAADYFKWACANGQEGMRVMADACRDTALEFHASVRANIYWASDFVVFGKCGDKLMNGKWWFEHPEARKKWSPNLDYAHPEARRFMVDLAVELTTRYDCAGFNLDFTRWPPVADPATHDHTVLATLIREVRVALDEVGRNKGRHLALSAIAVDGYHAGASLEEQRIDLDLWLKSGDLDFVCVEAWDHSEYRRIAEKHGVPYFITHDNETIHHPGRFKDPEWQQPDKVDEDPVPGEELEEEPHLNSSLHPTEYYEFCLDRMAKYRPEGFCFINNFYGWRSLGCLGHPDEMRAAIAAGMPWGQVAGARIECPM